jgi:hypothetical protein
MNSPSSGTSPSRKPTRAHRWLGTAAVGSLAFVALVVVLLPVSAMGAPTIYHTIVISAPFTGATSTPSMSLSTSGCGTATMVTAPFFHSGTGRGGFSGTAAASGCLSGLGSSGDASQTISVVVPFSAMSGHNRIVEKWSLAVSGGTTFHLGKCAMPAMNNSSSYSYCDVYSSSYLYGYSYLYDATNGSYIASPLVSWAGLSNGTTFYQYCYAGNCSTYSSGAPGSFSFTGALSWTFVANGLVSTHTYELATSFYGGEYASVSAYGATLHHTHASAWLNAGTFGNGLTLNSITVT